MLYSPYPWDRFLGYLVVAASGNLEVGGDDLDAIGRGRVVHRSSEIRG